MASFGLFSCTLSLFMPIWKPFMDWMAAWALPGLSKLTKPAGGREREKPQRCGLDAGRAGTVLGGRGHRWMGNEFDEAVF